MRTLCFIVLTVITLGLPGGPACAEKRVALVIGNSAYQNVTRLDNPKNDASLIAETMRGLGFALVGSGPQLDLDKAGLDRAVQNFGQMIQGAEVALFYYAGHGVQVNGSNFLVPVNANPTREADVDFQMVDVNVVLRQMQGSGTKLNLVILDACRNNPFGGRGLRATEGGLAQMRAPEGTLISYATQPGSVAQDGEGNSPYTKALAATVRRAGLDIFQTFNQVGLAVKRATGGSQQPWVSSSPIDGDFYFVPPPGSAVSRPSDVPVQDFSPAKSPVAHGNPNPSDARSSFEKAANAGDAGAMVSLGFKYEKGNGVPQDFAEARKWYEKAAAAGNTIGMRNLGILYRDGSGVAKNPAEARKWFEKAAAAGNADAMNSLGLLYENGVPKDYVTARKWFEKSATSGNAGAMVNLGFLYDKGYGGAQNFAEARKWYEKAAAAGNAIGMKNLGVLYRDGIGVAKDPVEARKWFEKAAASGNADSMTSVGYIHETGNGVPKDYVEARKWYEKGAAAGNANAMANLGFLYRDGRGVAQDRAEARKWFEKAAALDYDSARIALQRLDEQGSATSPGTPRP
jgi:TPR repeat protein